MKLVRKVTILGMFADECALSARPGEIGDLLSQRGNRAFRGRVKSLVSTIDYHQNKRFFAARNLNGFTPSHEQRYNVKTLTL